MSTTSCSDIALAEVAGPMKDLYDKLLGKDRAIWLEVFKLSLRTKPQDLVNVLRGMTSRHLKGVTVGGRTKQELLAKFVEVNNKHQKVDKVGIRISKRALEISNMPQCRYSTPTGDADFAIGTLCQLFGFQDYVKAYVFLKEDYLAKHGMEFCEPSDAFYVRIFYSNQPKDERLRVGMKSVGRSGYEPFDFCIEHDKNGLFLDAWSADPHRECGPGTLWIFRKKKTPAELGYPPDGLI